MRGACKARRRDRWRRAFDHGGKERKLVVGLLLPRLLLKRLRGSFRPDATAQHLPIPPNDIMRKTEDTPKNS